MKKCLILSFFLALLFQTSIYASAAETTTVPFDQTHSLYSNVLGEYVKEGSVDYRGIKSNPDELKSYLQQTSSVSKEEFETWSQDQQLAFLINVYNAWILDLIQENFPIVSIKDIAKESGGPWAQPIVQLFGDKITLNALEKELISKNYPEPRIHFALVCAAKGCPVLIDKPYLDTNLKSKLDQQTRVFLSDTDKNSIDTATKTLHLSPLFDWYSEDFVKESGSVIAFVNPYLGGKAGPDFKIEYTSYDWALNEM